MTEKLKSAVEIAMEKAKKMGGEDPVSLTANQKKKIAEIRKVYSAKIAEAEILVQDPEIQQHEIERMRRERQSKIESVYQKSNKKK